jgi:hypothetical protein
MYVDWCNACQYRTVIEDDNVLTPLYLHGSGRGHVYGGKKDPKHIERATCSSMNRYLMLLMERVPPEKTYTRHPRGEETEMRGRGPRTCQGKAGHLDGRDVSTTSLVLFQKDVQGMIVRR